MKGVILIGHGSRSAEAKQVFEQIVDSLKKETADPVEGCSMELSPPYLPDAVEKLISRGVTEIVVLPFFLFNGVHIRQDIPDLILEEKKNNPGVKFFLAKPIEYDPQLIKILTDRMKGETRCI